MNPVWGVKTADYADFVLPMPRNEKVKVGNETRYVETWRLYMQVAGRVKMLNDICEQHGYTSEEVMIVRTEEKLIECSVTLMSQDNEIVVRRSHGLARVDKGDSPWEKAETAARGRALGGLGIGVLPGTGIASLDEIQMVETYGVDLTPETEEVREKTTEEIIDSIVETKEELRQIRGQELEEIDGKLAEYVQKTYSVDIAGDDGLKWEKLNKGKLLLTHSQLSTQLKNERAKQEDG